MHLLVVSKWRRIAAKTTVQISSVFFVGNTSFGCTSKIIIKVNDNDGGRALMPALGCAVLISTLERRAVGRWVAGSVLIEYARAGRPSMAMKLRREWGAACLRESAPKNFTTSRVGCASARKLFFSSARWGGARKGGAGLRVEGCLCYSGEKTVY